MRPLDLGAAGAELERRRAAGSPAPMTGASPAAAAIAAPPPPGDLFRPRREGRAARDIARPAEMPEDLRRLVQASQGPPPPPKTAEDRLADAGQELLRRKRERLMAAVDVRGAMDTRTGELVAGGGIDLDAMRGTVRLLDRPEWAPVIRDLEAMGGLERWLRQAGGELGPQLQAGLDTDAMGRLAYRQMLGDPLSLDDLRMLGRGMGAGLAETVPGAAANLLGSMLPMVGSSIQAALAGASAGAAIGGAATLPAGGVGAVPGAVFGASAGAMGGALMHSYQVNAGHAWADYGEIVDEDGRGLDPELRRGGAILAGVLSAGLDSFGLGYLVSKFPGLDKLTAGGARALVRRLLEQPTMHQAMRRFAGAYAGGIVVETGTEVLQETVQIAVGELLKLVDERELAAISAEELQERLGSAAWQTARGMALLALPGPAASFTLDARAALRAGNERQAYLDLGEIAGRSQLRTGDPGAFQRFVGELQAEVGAPVQDILVQAEAFNTFFQSEGADPAAAAAELGVERQWRQATETGGDIAVPLEAWAARIAGTKAHQALADHVRLTPDAMTAAEARTFAQEVEELARSAAAAGDRQSPRARITADFQARLEAAGRAPDVAGQEAQVVGAFFAAMGERAGIDGFELYRSRGVDVERAVDGEGAAGRRAREPETLLAFLRRSGGLRDDGGELRSRDLAKAWPTMVRREGRSLDDAALAAWEAGYLGSREGPRPTPDALLAAIDEQLAGRPVYSERDRADAEAFAAQRDQARLDDETAYRRDEIQAVADELGYAVDTGMLDAALVIAGRDGLTLTDALDRVVASDAQQAEAGVPREARTFYQSVPTPDWLGGWLGLEGGRVSVNADGLFRKYQKRAGEAGSMRFASPAEIQAFVEETLANAHVAIEASSAEAVLVARIGDREQAVVVEDKGPRGGVVISAFAPDAGQLDAKIAKVVEDARRRDAVPAILVSPLAAADADTRLLVSRWLPLPLDRVQPGAYDLTTGKFLGNRTLFQRKGTKRGAISFLPSGRALIRLFDKADLSTVLHETGHLMIEVMGDLATAPEAPAALKADYDKLLAWLGVADRKGIETKHHEKLARAFEAYLMEGRAPSLELQTAFARFRAWLATIYRSVRSLKVELDDDVRRLFDRMLATDDAIAAAEAANRFEPLLKEPVAGITEGERKAYLDQAARATAEAGRRVETELREAEARERTAEWDAALERNRAIVRAETARLPAYRAMAFLGRGLDERGQPLPDELKDIKLDRDTVRKEHGKAALAALDAKAAEGRIAAKGGITPDQAAELLGFSSGEALVKAMVDAPDRDTIVERQALERTREELRSQPGPGAIAELAAEAVANDERSAALQAEARLIGRKAGFDVMPLQAVRAAAARAVSQMTVRELMSHDRHLYSSQRFAKEAQAAFAKGDWRGAAIAKNRQQFHFEIWRIAKKERLAAEKALEKWKKIARSPVKNLPAGHRDQILTLLERFELRKVSAAEVERRRSLGDWIAAQEKSGLQVDIPEKLQAEAMRRHYTELTVEDFMALKDAVAHIEHLGKIEGKLLANDRQADFETAAAAIASSIMNNNAWQPLRADFGPRRMDGVRRAFVGFLAAHTKVEFLLERLDGFKLGPAWDALFRPLAEAQGREQEASTRISEALGQIFGRYSRPERMLLYRRRIDVPELGTSFTRASLLSLALNWGNEGNRAAVMRGYGWDQPSIQAALDRHLDARDWQVVQEVWDLVDSFWPEIEALQRDLVGAAPPKVEPVQVKTPHGTLRGGYYPLVYDSDLSFKAYQREEAQASAELFGGNHTRPATRKGHTIARLGSGGQPPRLDLSVLPQHLSQVVHDLTHRRAVIDIARLIADDGVREAIEATAGREAYRLLRPWLTNVAAPAYDPGVGLESILARARTGTTIVNMGLKITTALSQPLGYLTTISHVGPRWAAIGLKEVFGKGPRSIVDARDFAFSRSAELRNRAKSFDRDVHDTVRRLTKAGPLSGMEKSYFWLTGFLDMAVALPTWHAAYQKALAADPGGPEADAVAAADAAVRMTQAAGGAKDLARIQRGGELARMFTLFYSWFSVAYNQFERAFRKTDFKKPRDYPQFVGAMAMLWLAPAILGELVVGRGPEEDEDLAAWAGKALLAYPAAAVVGVRDVVGAATSGFGYEVSPIGAAFGGIAKGAVDLATGNFDNRSAVQSAFLTASIWGHLPGRQAWITGEFFWDWLVNDLEPESFGEVLRHALLQRRPADERP